MKTMIVLSMTLLYSTSVVAQNPTVSWFTVDSVDYYSVSGCVGGSKVSFYSKTDGGEFLASVAVDSNGNALFVDSNQVNPARIINDGSKGSHNVSNIGPREFILANSQVSGKNTSTTTSWFGAANALDDLTFQVLRSTDGINFHSANTVNVHSNELNQYAFMDNWDDEVVFYKVGVISRTKGLRYMSAPMWLTRSAKILVFPTVVKEVVNVNIPMPIKKASYNIVNSEGRKVLSGHLSEAHSQISLQKLASGTYFIVVHNGKDTHSGRITKN